MSKAKDEQFEVGEKVYVEKFKREGVIKEVSPEATEGKGVVYTVELEEGGTRHFTEEDLE